jgi:hypothetical protein
MSACLFNPLYSLKCKGLNTDKGNFGNKKQILYSDYAIAFIVLLDSLNSTNHASDCCVEYCQSKE